MYAKLSRISLQTLPILLKILWASGQVVIDEALQEDNDVMDKYCPKSDFCREGTHVMCMYFNKGKPGHNCENFQDIAITSDMQSRILNVINAVRSKIAMGTEDKLPRGYSMYRLRWDTDLAYFAKVLANQCMDKNDFCRATDTFHSPGQILGHLAFTIPDWDVWSDSESDYRPKNIDTHNFKPGYNDKKAQLAVQYILRLWYKNRKNASNKMVRAYENLDESKGSSYLTMAVGHATHVGCGMAGFSDVFYRKYADHIKTIPHNRIQLICNFSHRPNHNMPVYPTVFPEGPGYSPKCGCPEDTTEDEKDCLCDFETSQDGIKPCSTDPEQNCEQTVVLLPIFKMENAPDDKLTSDDKGLRISHANLLHHHLPNSMEIIHFLEQARKGKNKMARLLNSALMPAVLKTSSTRYKNKRKGQYRRDHSELSTIYNDKNKMILSKPDHNHQPAKQVTSRKSSILTNTQNFKIQHNETDIIKKDVEPSDDFSNLSTLVNTYLTKHKDGNRNSYLNADFESLYDITTDAILNVEEKFKTNEKKIKQISNNVTGYLSSKKVKTKKINEDENILLTLLDTLEREVKHIDLAGNQKEIFDAKIRKIYGTVLGKSPKLLSQKQNKVHQTSPATEHRSNTKHFEPRHLPDDDMTRDGTKHIIDKEKLDDHNYIDDENNAESSYDRKSNMHMYNYLPESHNRAMRSRHYLDDEIIRNYMLGPDDEFNYRINDRFDELARAIYKDRVDYDDDGEMFHHKGLDRSQYAHRNKHPDDNLSDERKFYQEKLEDLERRLHEARSNRHNSGRDERPPPQMRRMRPTRDEKSKRSAVSKIDVDDIYIPDRARYLYGF